MADYHPISESSASLVYKICERVRYLFKAYTKMKVVQIYPEQKEWTLDEFVNWYCALPDKDMVETFLYIIKEA